MLFSWYRKLLRKPAGKKARRPQISGYRPCLDTLEVRIVPSFLPPATYTAGFAVQASAVGDFNGDGKPDIVTVGSLSGRGEVQVQLNNGDGTFTAGGLYATGNSPVAVKVGDFDNDGHDDIVTLAAYYTGALTTLKGNGDGSFQPYTSYTVLTPPTDVEVADVNGDGHVDLVAVNDFFGTMSEFQNLGDGTFGPKVDFPGGSAPFAVKVADFNGDGQPDVMVANAASFGGGLSLMLANGTGGFLPRTSIPAGTAPFALTVGDFNGDGKLDVAVANASGTTSINVLLSNGDGTFQPPVRYNTGYQPLDIKQADFNADGHIDLIERTTAGFVVETGNGDGTFTAPVVAVGGAGNSTLVADFNGDGVDDLASTTTAGSVTVQFNANDGVAGANIAAGFQISAPATVIAGNSAPVTVTALDANGNPSTTFIGMVTLTSSDPRFSYYGISYLFTAADAGTHTFAAVPFYTLGTQTIAVSSPLLAPGTQTITVTPAPATQLAVTTASTTVAGAPTTYMVIATDHFGNMVTNYTGTVHFTSNDVQAGLPADYTFTTADGGTHSFTATLKTAGYQVITAADTATPNTSGLNDVFVTPIAAASLSLSGGGGFIGSAHPVTIAALDPYGNLATSYNGTVHLSSSDAATVVGADVTLVNGSGTITVTPMTLGTQSLSATDIADGSMAGSESVLVTPGWAARFVMTAAHGTTAGVTQTVTVTAFDAFGNVSTVYTGTVQFSSSDFQAALPFSAFTTADQGVHTFTLAFRTAGSQSLAVSDWANPSATSPTQTGLVITPAAAASITVTPIHGVVAGTAQTLTITAKDAFGNVATSYRGNVAFSSSDKLAALPAAYTFTAADAGVHTFSVTLKSSGGQTFAVQDTANAANLAFTFSQRDIQVTPAAAVSVAFRAASNVTAGVAFSMTVQVVDAFGNIVTGYLGKIHFSGPSGSGNLLPADYLFTAADAGSHVFSVTLAATGTQTIGAADVANGAIKGSTSVKVVTGATSTGGGGGGGGTATGGGGGGGGGGKPAAV